MEGDDTGYTSLRHKRKVFLVQIWERKNIQKNLLKEEFFHKYSNSKFDWVIKKRVEVLDFKSAYEHWME